VPGRPRPTAPPGLGRDRGAGATTDVDAARAAEENNRPGDPQILWRQAPRR
jgi:hypothetical protein